MPWRANGDTRRRTPGEQQAYIQGFRAGAGLAVEYVAEGKPLGKVLDMAALLEEHAARDAEDDDAD